MYFLAVENICMMDDLNVVWNIVGWVVNAIWFGIPIILIILGMIDLGKAVIASKEDEVKKATKAFGKRFLYAVLVFLVVWIVQIVLNFVSGLGFKDPNGSDIKPNDNGWKICWCKITGDNDDACENN